MSFTRTLGDELNWATRSLEEVGIDSARLDAEVLLAYQLKTDRTGLILRSEESISPDIRTHYLALVARRASYEPIAYITRKQGFRHLELVVDPRVLIPRPETEMLVEAGLGLPQGARVVDVGTGSGAVALALKHERPDLHVTGLEVSAGALGVARMNASRLRLDVEFRESDLLDDGEYDAVIANLPYVADGTMLPPNVADYEPAVALFGGPDGLGLLRRMLTQLDDVPFLAIEIGFDQGLTADLVREAGFDDVVLLQDLAGLDRVVIGRRTAGA